FVLNTNHGLRAYTLGAGGVVGGPATLSTPAVSGGQLTFQLAGTPGASYVIEFAPVVTGTWQTVATVTAQAAPVPVSVPAPGGEGYVRAVAR
ncbi:MAG TPA: hypothetical protein PKE47_14370, partial [Verrucomicrobiota bacterium]|nr:hypothetical protein [Verrucomicrobiota bacterium]